MGESVAAFVLGNGPAKVTSYNFLQLRGGLSPRGWRASDATNS